MSTHDVPGAKAINRDELSMGCWAEHDDGSLIFVESTEDGRAIYSVFDLSHSPPLEYRDSMAIGAFKKTFSWNPKNPKSEKWTWHDKSPFPWDRIIDSGVKDGARQSSALATLNAAQRIVESRKRMQSTKKEIDIRDIEPKIKKLGDKANKIIDKIQRAINDLRV